MKKSTKTTLRTGSKKRKNIRNSNSRQRERSELSPTHTYICISRSGCWTTDNQLQFFNLLMAPEASASKILGSGLLSGAWKPGSTKIHTYLLRLKLLFGPNVIMLQELWTMLESIKQERWDFPIGKLAIISPTITIASLEHIMELSMNVPRYGE